MKKIIYKAFAFTAILSLMYSCESYDFGGTNDNLNNPSTAIPSSLLTGAQAKLSGAVTLDGTATPSLYVQHLSQTQYTEESRYQTINFSWNITGSGTGQQGNVGIYNKPILALQTIIDVNSDPETATAMSAFGSNNNQIAVAKILTAYYYQWMTDRWGMLPYSEALGGVASPYPAYDSQEAIYKGSFDQIDEALAQMDAGAGPDGDIFYGGDMTKWKKFANTLKMNMAIRLAKVYPAAGDYAATKFTQAMPGAISSVSENIMFPFISDDQYDNPYQDDYIDDARTDECLSDVLVDYMQDPTRNDPRLPMFGEPAVSTGTYVGLQYGWDGAGTIPNDDVSFMNDNLIKNGETEVPMFTYAQVSFNKAEAVLLGWIGGNAQTFYEDGIKASMEQWGVSSADATTYIGMSGVAYNASTGLQQIAEQKWLALFYQPYEAWAEWRRLDFPVLTPAVDILTGTTIPVRHGYPSAEPSQNTASYNAAVNAQGPDALSTKLWWDK
ncbi:MULTISPECIES: SusD/RagB family nutrient-binding outer membrane lipoprotein [Tenacibaculum]|uniref:SusD/RagB family nutrient-binding outer membrane lipoprotein n=1 Tax=Tenacibaculum TaxID=104267 RepID=UPI001F0A07B4|nr:MULTISPECIES: SusD/RagB family nutrient-binding outer membrane lipoprotein [Tenacibaculum]MCH3880842.1 SusD/RagB family nutrient-binding outer membrane lipoprotein [Tenacibaculum aquimarinum]MDO6599559.1 SusD/RagB family nutrient-binding outer membrane lipoprotein [Tenacibaculum sp. 1_MG-2023]